MCTGQMPAIVPSFHVNTTSEVQVFHHQLADHLSIYDWHGGILSLQYV
jgi:hypothetical protein